MFIPATEIKARNRVCVAIGYHRHQDQTRHDKIDIAEPFYIAYLRADQLTEDNKIQRHRNRWWQYRLHPDTRKTKNLFNQ